MATSLNNLAQTLQATGAQAEVEPLLSRALEIFEQSLGKEHHAVAVILNNLSHVLYTAKRYAEAEPLMRRQVELLVKFTRAMKQPHSQLQASVNNYTRLLSSMGRTKEEILSTLRGIAPEFFEESG